MCGCVCDDLAVTVEDGRVREFSPPCPLADPWLLRHREHSQATSKIDGQNVAYDQAIEHAVELLRSSRAPLVHGLSRSSTPGQRAACRLADRIGAAIDTTASTCHAPSIMALQGVGESTCSLGEVRHRSDVVVYWGSNPLKSHPRHMERYVDSPGMYRPNGRSDRHVVVVDPQATDSTAIANSHVQVDAGADFELITALRAVVAGIQLAESHVAGVSREAIEQLAKQLMEADYGAVFFGLGLTKNGVPHANVEVLLRLVTELNRVTRCVARRMRVPGDVAGADSVLCWQTGFPFSVNLNRGYPRYGPGEYTANSLLERREVDAVVLVGADGITKLNEQAQRELQRLPTIVLEEPTAEVPLAPTVRFSTAVYGIHRTGTAYRMDEIPIPLRSILNSSLPADHEVLASILERISQKSGA